MELAAAVQSGPGVERVDWRCKALLHRVLSGMPFRERLLYFFQRNVTKSLPSGDPVFKERIAIAKSHIAALEQYSGRYPSESVFYEFGAGWDLTIPLAFYALGVNRQITLDIKNLLKVDLVNDTIGRFMRHWSDLGCLRKPECRLSRERDALRLLDTFYGITYRAPSHARRTGFPSASMDFITSTNTLEHIPTEDIRAILRECHRVLKDDGVMSFVIDYQDHYAYFDESISTYNFLRYSDRRWWLYNPPSHYQSRLRHKDYLVLFRASGFEVLDDQVNSVKAADLDTLAKMSLAGRFRSYSLDDLAIRKSHVILRKVT